MAYKRFEGLSDVQKFRETSGCPAGYLKISKAYTGFGVPVLICKFSINSSECTNLITIFIS